MSDCVGCKNKIKDGNRLTCPNCKTDFCIDCAKINKHICPNCYHSLEFSG